MRSIQSRCYRTRRYTVCRHIPASFSLEMLQVGAVKASETLKTHAHTHITVNINRSLYLFHFSFIFHPQLLQATQWSSLQVHYAPSKYFCTQRLCVRWRMKRRNKQGGGYARWKAKRGSAYVRVFQTLLRFPHQPSHSSAIVQSEVTAVPQEAFLRVQNTSLGPLLSFLRTPVNPGPKTHLNCGGQAVVDSPESVQWTTCWYKQDYKPDAALPNI